MRPATRAVWAGQAGRPVSRDNPIRWGADETHVLRLVRVSADASRILADVATKGRNRGRKASKEKDS